jgi:hypothetical protein
MTWPGCSSTRSAASHADLWGGWVKAALGGTCGCRLDRAVACCGRLRHAGPGARNGRPATVLLISLLALASDAKHAPNLDAALTQRHCC